jgi:pimeloyl-ACP methyl ester carboxylesterase
LAASGDDAPAALDRLKRLLMERDGLFDEEKFGLYLWDHKTGRQKRCAPGAVGAGERPVIFVHGLRANGAAFGTYLDLFGAQKDFADRPILVFRYPNNESLSCCGELLTNEVKRTIAEPEKADFVCHSAGGLVFRWYAEVRHGGFDRAVLMATPNAGSALSGEKELVDCGRFLIDLPMGLPYAFDDAFGEGDGEIANDLHPDSLFLRRLGHDARLAARYHVFYGVFFNLGQELTLRVGFTLVKANLHDAVETYAPFPDLKQRLLRLVDAATLPEEIAHGDLIVSARSASLADAGRTTRANLMHEGFRFDPAVMRQVLASLRGEE